MIGSQDWEADAERWYAAACDILAPFRSRSDTDTVFPFDSDIFWERNGKFLQPRHVVPRWHRQRISIQTWKEFYHQDERILEDWEVEPNAQNYLPYGDSADLRLSPRSTATDLGPIPDLELDPIEDVQMLEAVQQEPDGTLSLRKRSLNLDEIMSIPSRVLSVENVYRELVMDTETDRIKSIFKVEDTPELVKTFLSVLPTYPARPFDVSILLDHFLYSKDFTTCKHEPFSTPLNSYLHNDEGQTVNGDQQPLPPREFGVRGLYMRQNEYIQERMQENQVEEDPIELPFETTYPLYHRRIIDMKNLSESDTRRNSLHQIAVARRDQFYMMLDLFSPNNVNGIAFIIGFEALRQQFDSLRRQHSYFSGRVPELNIVAQYNQLKFEQQTSDIRSLILSYVPAWVNYIRLCLEGYRVNVCPTALWSVEGVQVSYRASHVHLVFLYKACKSTLDAAVIREAFVKKLGTAVTIRNIRSIHQVSYILKEKFFIAYSTVLPEKLDVRYPGTCMACNPFNQIWLYVEYGTFLTYGQSSVFSEQVPEQMACDNYRLDGRNYIIGLLPAYYLLQQKYQS